MTREELEAKRKLLCQEANELQEELSFYLEEIWNIDEKLEEMEDNDTK